MNKLLFKNQKEFVSLRQICLKGICLIPRFLETCLSILFSSLSFITYHTSFREDMYTHLNKFFCSLYDY